MTDEERAIRAVNFLMEFCDDHNCEECPFHINEMECAIRIPNCWGHTEGD